MTSLNVDLSEAYMAALKELMQRKEVSLRGVLRRAIALYKFVDDEVGVRRRKLHLVDQDGIKVGEITVSHWPKTA
jgi:hypothetical protein